MPLSTKGRSTIRPETERKQAVLWRWAGGSVHDSMAIMRFGMGLIRGAHGT